MARFYQICTIALFMLLIYSCTDRVKATAWKSTPKLHCISDGDSKFSFDMDCYEVTDAKEK